MKIAILGSSGHIGKNLIHYLKDDPDFSIYCFSRSLGKIDSFILYDKAINCVSRTYDQFTDSRFDAIINCIGIGDPASLRIAKDEIFILTEYYDNLILDNLKRNKSTVYINISSGAVYGTDFGKPVNESFNSTIDVNNITSSDHYRISKLNSESKHRALKDLNIIDLRVFGFFSRFIELKKEFLLCEIIKSVIERKVFVTSNENIKRDYIHPEDLIDVIKICISKNKLNDAFDLYSKAPVSKSQLIDFFDTHYSLKYKTDSNASFSSITGSKLNYYSLNKKIERLYSGPKYSSLQCIASETEALFKSFV